MAEMMPAMLTPGRRNTSMMKRISPAMISDAIITISISLYF
jgi:hypothetical protein